MKNKKSQVAFAKCSLGLRVMVGNRRLGSKTTLVHCGPPACQARGYTVFTMGYEGVTHIVTQRCGYSSGSIGALWDRRGRNGSTISEGLLVQKLALTPGFALIAFQTLLVTARLLVFNEDSISRNCWCLMQNWIVDFKFTTLRVLFQASIYYQS